jgi:hypothetical protein
MFSSLFFSPAAIGTTTHLDEDQLSPELSFVQALQAECLDILHEPWIHRRLHITATNQKEQTDFLPRDSRLAIKVLYRFVFDYTSFVNDVLKEDIELLPPFVRGQKGDVCGNGIGSAVVRNSRHN